MTIFLSAFLLFQVQPILGKTILPWFGGSAATWMTCLLFFQTLLLAGYLYAHWLVARVPARLQGLVHAGVLVGSLALLPVVPAESWKPTDASDPTLRILLLLLVTVGGPFFVLSSTGPLIQAWYARLRPGRSPYRLYALSNGGSLIALLSYPFVFEPVLRLRTQTTTWSTAYVAFVLLCGGWALRASARGTPAVAAADDPAGTPVDGVTVALWIALAACGSAMLLATTGQITLDVAPIPFLWILPLSLYLASFILCFGRRSWYSRKLVGWGFAASLLGVGGVTAAPFDLPLVLRIGTYAAALFLACTSCHGELSRLQPANRHLTAFYLCISLGGALGGALVTLVAPLVFDSLAEFPLALVACALAASTSRRRDGIRESLRRRTKLHPRRTRLELLGSAAVAVAIALGLGRLWGAHVVAGGVVASSRNFYGTLRLIERDPDDPSLHRLELTHGGIVHGLQFLDPARRAVPGAYYGEGTGLDQGLRLFRAERRRPLRIGAIGMGAAILATYAAADDEVAFYELDPEVVRLARSPFTFLRDAESRGVRIDVHVGDARLALERELAGGDAVPYDVLVVDAFSGDAIPIHLLTAECFRLYDRRVARDGLLLVHTSNLYLHVSSVVRQQTDGLAWVSAMVATPADPSRVAYSSDWVLASPDADLLAAMAPRLRGTSAWPADAPARPWTDDASSLFSILK